MISDDLTLNTPVPARTPNLDLLRASGVSFPHTYAQLCSCAPSRVAIFTSLRPDQTGGWTNAREDKVRFLEPPASPYTLLPQAFRDNGYYVRAYGKLLHRGRRAAGASIEILRSVDAYLRSPEPFRFYHDNRTVRGGVTKAELERTTGDVDLALFDAGQTAEGISVPDDAYEDGWYGDNASAWVRDWPANAAPFFLCIGFWRPHIPFNAPKMYWDYYGAAEVAAAIPDRYDGMRQMPRGTLSFTAPAAAELLLHGQDFSSTEQEFIPRTPFGLGNGVPNSTMCGDPLTTCWMRPTPLLADARNLLHGYLASVSFIDAQALARQHRCPRGGAFPRNGLSGCRWASCSTRSRGARTAQTPSPSSRATTDITSVTAEASGPSTPTSKRRRECRSSLRRRGCPSPGRRRRASPS